LQCQIAEGGG
jgi:hypothetical protein